MFKLFIALPINKKVQQDLIKAQVSLQNNLKNLNLNWVCPENLHITLTFIGNVNATQKEDIKHALSIVKANRFSLRVGEITSFRHILCVKIIENKKLNKLKKEIDSKLFSVEAPYDNKSYLPHITLFRINKKHSNLLKQLKLFKNFNNLVIDCDCFILYKSILKSDVVSYKPLQVFNLLNG